MPSGRSTVGTAIAAIAIASAVGGCQSCTKAEPTSSSVPPSSSGGPAAQAAVVKESLPRCRVDGARLAIPGDDVVAGDAVVAAEGLLVGVVRREGTKHVAGLIRASLDLAAMKILDVGLALGDDPPPSPRLHGTSVFVTSFARAKDGAEAGAGAPSTTRVLEIARLEGAQLVSEGAVVQQADESLAYDVAWPAGEKGPPLVAWDEDAPARAGALLADRGVVKVQVLGAGAKSRVASPETTDAESPRLLARPGGYWLAWLARRTEAGEDAGERGGGSAAEGPGERRAYRWIELVALDARGEAASPVRRVSPEKGRVASFELASAPSSAPSGTTARGEAQLVVVVQDEAAPAEGAGERIVRYAVDGERIESAELLDGGVGHALAELLGRSADAAAPRWLVFTDTQEHAHLVPLGPSLRLAGAATTEPSLDGARIVATALPDIAYAVGSSGAPESAVSRVELRRLVCR